MIKNNIFIGNTTLIIIYDTVPIFWSWESCLLKLLFEISLRFDRIASVLPSILPDFFGYFFSKYTCKAFYMIAIVFFVLSDVRTHASGVRGYVRVRETLIRSFPSVYWSCIWSILSNSVFISAGIWRSGLIKTKIIKSEQTYLSCLCNW